MSEVSEDLKSLLEEWELGEYVDRFTRAKILKLSTLKLMTEGSAEKIFPEEGLRLEFWEHLSALKQQGQQQQLTGAVAMGDSTGTILVPLTGPMNPAEDAELLRSLNGDDLNSETTGDGGTIVLSPSTSTSPIPFVVTTTNTFAASTPALEISNDTSTGTSENENSRGIPTDESPISSRKRPITGIYDLEDILMMHGKGRTVMSTFNAHNNVLTETLRNIIADAIIADHLRCDVNKSLTAETLNIMFAAIKGMFPKEHELIWLGSLDEKRESSKGRGKLLTRYYNVRRTLTKSGLIAPRRLKATSASSASDTDDVEPVDVTNDITWLKNSKDPWDMCIDKWKTTSKHRIRQLHEKKTTVHSYMSSFPGLKDKAGYLLLGVDFEVMHPNSSMKLYSEWPKLSAFITSKIDITVVNEIKECFTPDGTKLKTLHSLCNLFPVVTAVKKGKTQKTHWRPSRQEVKESLILVVPTGADIQPELLLRREKYLKFGLSLGPQAVVVGEADAPQQSYVIINQILYELDSPMKALDVAFKAMFALDAAYPKESGREWMFLQRAVYGVETASDKVFLDARVNALIGEYKMFK